MSYTDPTTPAFLPPGVQAKICAALRLSHAPDAYPLLTGTRLSMLWTERNECAESEIDRIDREMYREALAGWAEVHGAEAIAAHEKLVSLNAALCEQLERTTQQMVDLDDICGGARAEATILLARENERLIAEAKAVQP